MPPSYAPPTDTALNVPVRENKANRSLPALPLTLDTTPPAAHKTSHGMGLEFVDNPLHTPTEMSAVSSPTSFSEVFSGIEQRPPPEIASLVRSTYAAIYEKEKDLQLAAELGRSLLEDNMNMEMRYTQLLQHQQGSHSSQTRLAALAYGNHNTDNSAWHSQRPCSPHSSRSGHAELIAGPQRSVVTGADQESVHTNDSDMQLMPSHYVHNATVAMLSQKNAEIQAALNRVVQSNKAKLAARNEKTQKMLQEIDRLQYHLEEASCRIQELEKERHKNLAAVATMSRDPMRSSHANEKNQLATELAQKLVDLQNDNQRLTLAKAAAEERLEQALRNIDDIKKEFDALEGIEDKFESQQRASQQQREQIAVLNHAIEDYRTVLTRVRDRGLWSAEDDGLSFPSSPREETDGEGDSTNFSLSDLYHRQQRREKERRTRDLLPRGPAMPKPSESLLSELQRTWQKDHQPPPFNERTQTPNATSAIANDEPNVGIVDTSLDPTHTLPHMSPPSLGVITKSVASSVRQEYNKALTLSPISDHHTTDDDDEEEEEEDCGYIYDDREPSNEHDDDDDEDNKASQDDDYHKTGDSPRDSFAADPYKSITYWGHGVADEHDDDICTSIRDHLYPEIPENVSRTVALYKRNNGVHWQVAPVHVPKRPRRRRFSLWRILFWIPLYFFELFWGWVRFSIVLAMATIINIWQGPDAILEK